MTTPLTYPENVSIKQENSDTRSYQEILDELNQLDGNEKAYLKEHAKLLLDFMKVYAELHDLHPLRRQKG